MLTLAEAQTLLPGATLVGPGATAFERVHSDTRSLQPGDLFVALRGERFDAHEFLPAARAAGAVAALAQRGLGEATLPGLQVGDTRLALGTLAAAWRRRCTLPLIAVAGSNGKTTVTQMIATILRAWLGEAAFSTQGNLNNDIGVPLTLLRLRPGLHRAGVVELGMNHPGEIAALAAWAAPTVALVNNAQREHQEFMASVEAVARENGAVIEALGAEGIAVFPADDGHASVWRRLAGGREVMDFCLEDAAGVCAAPDAAVRGRARRTGDGWRLVLTTPAGVAEFDLGVAGRHNLHNALAAAAASLAAGAPLSAVVTGLEAFVPVKGRSQSHRITLDGRAVGLVDDTYNANPDSVRAAIDVLADEPGPRWLVLGDMGEVGTQGPAFHREVGAHARDRGIDTLWTVGPLCAEAADAYATPRAGAARVATADVRHFDSVAALIAALPEQPPARSVLVKGSRFMRMEQVVAALRALERAGSGDAA